MREPLELMPRVHDLPRILGLILLIAVLSGLSIALTRFGEGVASVWIANGVLVGAMLLAPLRHWSGYLVAAIVGGVLARIAVGDAPVIVVALTLANVIEVFAIAGMIRLRVQDVSDPANLVALGRVAFVTTLWACALSATLAATTLWTLQQRDFGLAWLSWYTAHLIGMVVVATLTVVGLRERRGLFGRPGKRRHFILPLVVLAVVTAVVFWQDSYPLLFLVFPPLMWLTFRHRFSGVVVGVLLISIVAGVASATGHGPLSLLPHFSAIERTLLLQVYIGAACLFAMPVALVLGERARLVRAVRESESRYRLLEEHSHDLVARIQSDGNPLYISPSVRSLLGWEPHELTSPRWELVHPEDREQVAQAMADLFRKGGFARMTYRIRHKDGHYVWLEKLAQRVDDPEGGEPEVVYSARDISERKQTEIELDRLARSDALTGLANRRQFEERIERAVRRSQRHGLPIALISLDIDHFKQINDTRGHAAGDQVLIEFGRRLSASVYDLDLVARLGGDEFVALIEDAGSVEIVALVASRIHAAMQPPFALDSGPLAVGSSIGAAWFAQAPSVGEVLERADQALYSAKQAGRNTWRVNVLGSTSDRSVQIEQGPEKPPA